MPRSRARVNFSNRPGPVRQTLWGSGVDETGFTAVAANGADLQGTLNASGLALRPFTIIRVRGMLSIVSDQVAASEEIFGAFGMAVVGDQASVTGITAMPTPITEEFSDQWFLHQHIASAVQLASAASMFASGFQVEFDSKAMRKVEDDFDFATIFENGSATTGLKYLAKLRFLLKLH